MKRSEALDKIESFLVDMIDKGYIKEIDKNGMKCIAICGPADRVLLKFIEKELRMLPPLQNKGCLEPIPDDCMWNQKMYLKLMALLYRHTGWFCPYAKVAEYEHIMSIIDQIEIAYEASKESKDGYKLKTLVKLQIGGWQAKNGFIRRNKNFERR